MCLSFVNPVDPVDPVLPLGARARGAALVAAGLCALLLAAGCAKTECVAGQLRCSDDMSALLSCDRGEWVEEQACGAGAMCMEPEEEESEDAHASHEAAAAPACVAHEEAGAEAGAAAGTHAAHGGGA